MKNKLPSHFSWCSFFGGTPARRCVAAALLFAQFALLAAVPAQSQQDHVIEAGDALQVVFLNDAAEPVLVTVGSNGDVHLPYLGSVRLAGSRTDDAALMISDLYTERDIYFAPEMDVIVTNFRPIVVIGDVKTPGRYEFLPFLTVEQAVGLAGGPQIWMSDEESRSLQRSTLRGQLISIEGELGQRIVAAARLRTQLDGGSSIRPQDIRETALPNLDSALLKILQQQENEILAAERENYIAEREHLESAIRQAREEVALGEMQIATQEEQAASYDRELESSRRLVEQGIVVASALTRLERQISEEKRVLLQFQSSLAAARRLLSALEREYQSLDFKREQTWRLELVQVEVRTSQLLSDRRSLLERLALLDDWSSRAAETEGQIGLQYLIRRRDEGGEQRAVSALPADELKPGDTLIVQVSGAELAVQADGMGQ